MLGRSFNRTFTREPLDFPWQHLENVCKRCNGIVGNLEFAITDSRAAEPKTFNFKLNPRFSETLTLGRFVYVSMANNHSLDYGVEGLDDTLQALDKLKISHAGAGLDQQQAREPAFIELDGLVVGFLSISDHPSEWAARVHKPGIWFEPLQDPSCWPSILSTISQVRAQCDALVLSLHWMANWVDEIPLVYREFAHAAVEAGVTVIHGHSPHHLLPYERVNNNSLIFYSLGSFVDDYAIDRDFRNDLSALVEVKLAPGSAKIQRIYETQIVDQQVFVQVFVITKK